MIRSAISPKLKSHKCKVCHEKFVKARSIQPTCEKFECRVAYAEKVAAKAAAKRVSEEKKAAALAKKAVAQELEKHKPLSHWLKIAERWCNAYIRERDPDVCISCGVTHSSAWQAGHYIAVGANSTLRFDEDNIHKQCIQCNMFKGSNATQYRIGLVAKIGVERVDRLESWHAPVKMTKEAAQEIADMYKAKLKELKGRQA